MAIPFFFLVQKFTEIVSRGLASAKVISPEMVTLRARLPPNLAWMNHE